MTPPLQSDFFSAENGAERLIPANNEHPARRKPVGGLMSPPYAHELTAHKLRFIHFPTRKRPPGEPEVLRALFILA